MILKKIKYSSAFLVLSMVLIFAGCKKENSKTEQKESDNNTIIIKDNSGLISNIEAKYVMKTCKLANGDNGVKCITSTGLLCTAVMTCKKMQGSVSSNPSEPELHVYATQNTIGLMNTGTVLQADSAICDQYLFSRLYSYYFLNEPWQD